MSPCSTPSAGLSFFVSTRGDDRNEGSHEHPFATLERARDMVRTRKQQAGLPTGGIIVWLEDGRYRLATGFSLQAVDSGSADAPITYRACPNHHVVLTGAVPLSREAFKPVTARRILKRIVSPEARAGLLFVDLKAQGLEDFGALRRRGYGIPVPSAPLELFVDGQRMTRARWPNEGTFRMGAVVHDGKSRRRFAFRRRRETFRYEGNRPDHWRRAREVWLDGIFSKDWVWSYNRVAKINHRKRTITLRYAEKYGLLQAGRDALFAENLLEEIDRPGEYYLDVRRGTLYLLPPEGFEDGAPDIQVSRLHTAMLDLQDVSFVSFKDLILDTGRDLAVSCKGGEGCRFERCELRHFACGGFNLEGLSHAVVACHIHHVGGTCIRLAGGDLQTLAPGGMQVENCHIHHWGYWQKAYASAVELHGVGHRVRHCLIHDGPHLALHVGGNDHCIEYNEVHNVVLDFRDMGALYLNQGFYPLRRGTLIRRNYFHHIGQQQDDVHGIYIDNATMGLCVEENVFFAFGSNTNRNVDAVKANGTSYVTVRNNVFIECANTFALSFFLNGWGRQQRADYEQAWAKQLQDLSGCPHARRYPELTAFFEEDRVFPISNVFESNLIYNHTVPRTHPGAFKTTYGPALLLKKGVNPITRDDPGVVDLEAGTFPLCEAVAASWPPGMAPIPFDTIGLQQPAGPG